jgi:putative membrane protein
MTTNRFDAAVERARSGRPITWVTLVGVLLLPVLVGGILITALYNPTQRLDHMSAAIVNQDKPVTLNGQLAPLGRQLTAGLVRGTGDATGNLDWTISNAKDAAAGLADGAYQAVVTIPADFSAAATSAGQTLSGAATTPKKASIAVETAPDALVVDDAITAQITNTAASIMGEALSSATLKNIFIGYATLGDRLGDAANGATTLAGGAQSAASGAAALPGAEAQLQSGAAGLSSGASQLSTGLSTIAGKTRAAASGADQLAAGVRSGAATLRADGLVPPALQQLATGTAGAADATAAATAGVATGADSASSVATTLQSLAASCIASGASTEFCGQLSDVSGTASTVSQNATAASAAAAQTSALTQQLRGGLDQVNTDATAQVAGQLDTIADNVADLGGGLTQLAGGVDKSAAGATTLATGGAQLADGIGQVGDGTQTLADGVARLADGTDSLASGLHQAVHAIPSLDDAKATRVADVLAAPVAAKGAGTTLFGASAIPLLAMIALWFGALASFVVLQAVSRRTLTSRRSSALLTLRSLAPAAAIGATQGLLVAVIVQVAASYDVGVWSVFAAVSVVAGVAFAAVNQALIAVFGGAGRWIAALVGVLAVATGVVSTVPGALSAVASVMPTAPAYNGLLAALTTTGGVGAGIGGLLIWSLLAFVASTVAVARRRMVSTRTLQAATV